MGYMFLIYQKATLRSVSGLWTLYTIPIRVCRILYENLRTCKEGDELCQASIQPGGERFFKEEMLTKNLIRTVNLRT